MADVAQHIITFLTSGLLLYFLHENLKTAKDADNWSRNNGIKLQDLAIEIESIRSEVKSLINSIETNTDRISIYQKNLDRAFDMGSGRHQELMEKHEALMKQQREVISTVDLERSRLDSFAEAGIKLADQVSKNISKVKRFEDFITKIKKRLNDDEERKS